MIMATLTKAPLAATERRAIEGCVNEKVARAHIGEKVARAVEWSLELGQGLLG